MSRITSKKKNFTCLICFLVLILFVLDGCSRKEHLFERTDAEVKKEGKVSLKKDYFGKFYYERRNVTFQFQTNSHTMKIQADISGELGVNFNCFADSPGVLRIYKKQSSGTEALQESEKLPLKKGYNDISFLINLGKNEELIVKDVEEAGVVFSKPVIYRILPPEERINIFLISVDTLSALHMGLYGYQRKTTPEIEEFSRDAVTFLNAFSNSSWTVSSHMSLFTSLLEHGHRVEELKNYVIKENKVRREKPTSVFPLAESIPFLVEPVSDDFITMSYNGGVKVNAVFGFYRGFDLYFSLGNDFTSPRASETLFQKAKDKLVKSKFPKAFYFLHTYQVHAPHNPLKPFLDKISKDTKLKRFDYEKDLGGNRYIFKECDAQFIEDIKSLYDAEILYFDYHFGKFVEFLKAQDLYDNSMIILFSDHGEEFFEHERWAHGSDLYDEQIKIPLLIKFPQQQFGGKKIKQNVTLLDVFPTLMEFYSIESPKDVNGDSLMPVIKDGKEFNRPVVSSIFRFKPFEMLPGKLAVIKDNYKMIYNDRYTIETYKYFVHTPPKIESTVELFDLEKDPRERTNIFFEKNSEKDYLLQYIKKLIKEMNDAKKSKIKREKEKISDEMREKLKALGYIEE